MKLSIDIPPEMIKNLKPSLIAESIVGVQPMTEGEGYAMKIITGKPQREPKEGEMIHCFVRGFLIYKNGEFVPLTQTEGTTDEL